MTLRTRHFTAATTHPVDATAPATALTIGCGGDRVCRRPRIDTHRCTGCGRCVAACDLHLLSLEAVRWVKFSVLHEPDRCTGCSQCAVRCPFHAIAMRAQAMVGTFNGGCPPTTPFE